MEDSSPTAGSTGIDEKPFYDIGVLFVHGIGLQRRGQTLAEFGGAIYGWLADRFCGLDYRWRHENSTPSRQPSTTDAAQQAPTVAGTTPTSPQQDSRESQQSELLDWRDHVEHWADDGFPDHARPRHPDPDWLAPLIDNPDETDELKHDTIVGRVRLADTVITDPSDPSTPAHAKLLLQRKPVREEHVETERWLLSESWWAESFPPPSFKGLALWGLSIIPWVLGSHLGASIYRVWTEHPEKTGKNKWYQSLLPGVWRVLRLAVSCFWLFVGLLVTPFLLLALSVLLIATKVPIPAVGDALVRFQLWIASTLGDSFILLRRPLEASAIVGQVSRDLRWLEERCKAIVVVAHSQGAALAYQSLQRGIPDNLRLFFTFGSGIKKLKQIEYAQKHRIRYLLPAAATIVCPFIFLPMFLELAREPIFVAAPDSMPKLFWIVFASVLFVAGVRDFRREIKLPDVQRWIQRLGETPVRWVDCFASADPISDGPLLDELAAKECSQEVCNRSAVHEDHTSYWENKDEFVSILLKELLRPELRNDYALRATLAFRNERLKWIRRRRRSRVQLLMAIRLIFLLSMLAAIYQYGQHWLDLLSYGSDRTWAWLNETFGGTARPARDFGLSWAAIGYLALAYIPFRIARWRWQRWDKDEMRTIVQHVKCDSMGSTRLMLVCMLMSVQILILVVIVTGEVSEVVAHGWWKSEGGPLLLVGVFVFVLLRLVANSLLPRDETPYIVKERTIKRLDSWALRVLTAFVPNIPVFYIFSYYQTPFHELVQQLEISRDVASVLFVVLVNVLYMIVWLVIFSPSGGPSKPRIIVLRD